MVRVATIPTRAYSDEPKKLIAPGEIRWTLYGLDTSTLGMVKSTMHGEVLPWSYMVSLDVPRRKFQKIGMDPVYALTAPVFCVVIPSYAVERLNRR